MIQSMSNAELSVFSSQLAMILHSGISSIEGISIMRDDMPEGEGRNILDAIYQNLDQTGDLAEAFRSTGVFPNYYLKMTELGAQSGTLEEVMDALALYYERQDSLTRSIRDALVYPFVLLGMLFAVLVVLMRQVMPVFRQVFDQLGIEITGLSGIIFSLSNTVQRIAVILLIILVLFVAFCLIAMRSAAGRQKLLAFVHFLPIGRKIITLQACARFTDTLSIALHSGLDTVESMELAKSLAASPDFQSRIGQAVDLIENGTDIASALRESNILTGLNARMFSIGYHTGTPDAALRQISASCQDEADYRIQSAVGALEPTLTAVLSILTGLILVSVMLPLLGVMASIG